MSDIERAKNQGAQLLEVQPEFGVSVRSALSKWYTPDLVEHWVDGLRKAGLEIPEGSK